LFARDLETAGRARATVTRRLSTIAGLYKYAVEEDLLDHSAAADPRRPRIDYESHTTGLDRNEVGALLVAAGLGIAAEHALVSLLALNGLRVSEATGSDIEALGTERGRRTLAITRKGGKRAVIPLAPRTALAIDLAIGERCKGPIFTTTAGERLDRHGAGRIVRRVARRAGRAGARSGGAARIHDRGCRPCRTGVLRPYVGLPGGLLSAPVSAVPDGSRRQPEPDKPQRPVLFISQRRMHWQSATQRAWTCYCSGSWPAQPPN
jgi:integrase